MRIENFIDHELGSDIGGTFGSHSSCIEIDMQGAYTLAETRRFEEITQFDQPVEDISAYGSLEITL